MTERLAGDRPPKTPASSTVENHGIRGNSMHTGLQCMHLQKLNKSQSASGTALALFARGSCPRRRRDEEWEKGSRGKQGQV